MNNQDTEVSYVSILASSSNEQEERYNYSKLLTKEVDTFNAIFHVKCSTDEQITVNITVFDKCGQESLSSMVGCESEGTNNIIFDKYCQQSSSSSCESEGIS
jgi:hypothetical protein